MVQRMPASEFIKFSKAAKMLFAERRICDIETAAFPYLQKQEDKDKIMRHLVSTSKEFITEGMANFADFAANFAKKVSRGRH